MTRVAILGSGSWGTAFGKILTDAREDTLVTLWARRETVAAEINERHLNREYFPDVELSERMTATTDPAAAVRGASVVVVAVPSQSARALMERVAGALEPDAIVVSLMKGLERGTHLRMSQVLAESLGLSPERIAVVSGPNLAREIVDRQPTASVVAAANPLVAARIAELCTAPYFRPYTNTDVVGVEVGGVVKNIIAVAVGMCDGLGVGDNSKASIMTRGLAETMRLALALGGLGPTLAGLAGMGDLVATCSSRLSRNNTAGRLLAEGLTPDEVAERMSQVAEGVKSAAAVAELAAQYDVRMPITQAVVDVVEGRLAVNDMGARLMGRDLTSEGEL
ncbi:NAD(P)H-dependent glycerol-3-phosphate dehydrogenase [Falsarthrobacter nasiphocae]|uniref:Glycerol-3-phosphate dehydrogenase [NAD(P)+] n=1 Tax=Falsarthrobacter nasiphocae TaxID=189863 RepID=A0AAE4C6Q7_9MICC|nr:NAD(P)H-dependent glycerol-3-phosphate dehydrogenase [Falsarthrobacter nasiphocae]MDR6892838.1 glycerol-3-phosphate dehydrogenase (NAD(P)+) [Falsarthrobacter nasiphocae]